MRRGEELWASAYLLSGLRFNAGESEALLGKVVAQMRESSTYPKILADGKAEGVLEGERNLLVLVGTTRFGPPGPEVRQILEIASETQLQAWAKRLLEVKSWPELVVAA